MRVVIDDKIPYIHGILEPFAEVNYITGNKISKQNLINADALIIRTRTICNAELLEGTSVKFIATATIGFDHIDTAYCDQAGIKWVNAPGCNSSSVEQYMAAALISIAIKEKLNLQNLTIGIIGVGNVGTKTARIAELLGMRVLRNDPPRARMEGHDKFNDLSKIQEEADIITLHMPLNKTGIDKNFHLINENFLASCIKKPWIINTCRGEITHSKALITGLKNKYIQGIVLDCWENEPFIDSTLLDLCFISTPHIAGYSKDGKANGTNMAIQALSKFFNLGIDHWRCPQIEDAETNSLYLDGKEKTTQEIISNAILFTYPIHLDSNNLKANINSFEELRGNYPVRREFPYYTIYASNINNTQQKLLTSIGFQVIMKD